MILLLNYLPTLILFLGLYLVYRVGKSRVVDTPEQRIIRVIGVIVITIGAIFGLQAATPHYMPKHVITRSPIPEVVPMKGEIKNIQPKAMSGEERDRIREQAYKETLPFVEQNRKKDVDTN